MADPSKIGRLSTIFVKFGKFKILIYQKISFYISENILKIEVLQLKFYLNYNFLYIPNLKFVIYMYNKTQLYSKHAYNDLTLTAIK